MTLKESRKASGKKKKRKQMDRQWSAFWERGIIRGGSDWIFAGGEKEKGETNVFQEKKSREGIEKCL